jgi:hypothetical protein
MEVGISIHIHLKQTFKSYLHLQEMKLMEWLLKHHHHYEPC